MSRGMRILLWGVGLLLFACGVGSLGVVLGWALARGEGGGSFFGGEIAVVRIEGTLRGGRIPRTAGAEALVETLDRLTEADWPEALVLRIDSPGGEVVASDEVYRAVRRFREQTGKPVVAYIGGVGASGAYYIAVAADRIVVHPQGMTGSIGVLLVLPEASVLFKKLGVNVQVLTVGAHKDGGSYFRPLTEEEVAIWKRLLTEVYDRFVAVVAEGRGMSEARVRELADGRVYSGAQAVELGLADAEGEFRDALKLAWELAGREGEPRWREVNPPPLGILEQLGISTGLQGLTPPSGLLYLLPGF